MYGTNDTQQLDSVGKDGKNTYQYIHSLVMLSTDDMVNWTYHGLIDVKALSPWGIASWAPSIVSRVEADGKTHFYLYYSNSGAGVGVLTSTSPVGPWTDPLGRMLVSQFTQGLGNCKAPFDPGAVIDDMGTGWLSFGGGGKGDHPSFGILTAASEALKSIGFDLTINDLADGTIMWDALNSETAEMWCAAWQATLDPDMFQIYHSEGGSANYYAIYSDELDELVMEGRTNTDQAYRKAVYKEALDFIVDYAVEIPVYQRQNASVFSTQRVNADSIPQDLTTFYSYLNEIEKIQMN